MNTSLANATIWSSLSAEEAYQLTVSTRVIAGTLAIMSWDILNNLNSDYRLLFKYRIGLPTVAYFASRLGALGYILTSLMLEVATIGSCKARQQALAWTYAVCIPATSLLFFFRIRAVFLRCKYVIWFFSFMWLAVVGAALTVPQALDVTSIGSTRYCASSTVKPFAVVCIIIPLANDTLVLLAVTVGLGMNAHLEPTLRQGIRTVMYGDYLPAFSRAILRDNQMYYLATVVSNLLSLVIFYVTSFPLAYRTMFMVPNVMLTNIMACRVFRNTKFGKQWMDSPTTTAVPTRRGPQAPNHAMAVSAIAFREHDPNYSITHELGLISETRHQSRVGRGAVEGGKLEEGDVIEIYPSHKI